MLDQEKVIKGLENQLEDLKKYADNDQPLSLTQEQAQEIISLLKEQEEKPLRRDKCNYHREDGWCGMHKRWVKETDYCSWGAWKER